MPETPRTILNQHTLIPVSVLLIVVGGVFWLTSIFVLAETNATAIIELRDDIALTNKSRAAYRQRLWEAIRSQDARLARIEGKLDVITGMVTERLAEDPKNK